MSNASRSITGTTANADGGGVLQNGYESVPSMYRNELDSFIPQGTESGPGHRENECHIPMGTEQQRQLLIYPEGEVDAVTITVGDVEGLKPTKFLSDNVIDFYIKYLQRGLSVTDNGRCHFFNSFFLRKLVDNSKTLADQEKVGYEQVRKWTRDVNLFEKDYVFIPVNQSSHWSLIIICHLRGLANSHDECRDLPCILHLDSYEGQHEGIETPIRNYIEQAWMEKYQATNCHQVVSHMKFVQTQVPQQNNNYDCGIYLLQYVELFLKETMSLAFASNQGIPHFLKKDWFKSPDVSLKRMKIINLIFELRQVFQEQGYQTTLKGKDVEGNNMTTLNAQPAGMENTLQSDEIFQENQQRCDRALFAKGKRKRDNNWTKDETTNLINLKKAFADIESRICTGKSNTDWVAIAEKMPTHRTGDQCRLRWDTLIKSYQKIKNYCRNNNTKISEFTTTERAELKLPTTMSEDWWYDVIDQSCQARHRKGTSLKVDNANIIGVTNDPLPSGSPFGTPRQIRTESHEPGESSRRKVTISGLSPMNPVVISDSPLPIQSLASKPTRESSWKQIAIPGYNSMSQDLKCTLLNLIQAWPTFNFNGEMEEICRWLAIMQDRKPEETHSYVLELCNRKLLTFCIKENITWLKFGHLRVYKKCAKKLIRKFSRRYNTHCHRVGDNTMLTFESMSMPKQTRVLTLLNCLQLKRADLGNLSMLRSLVVKNCPLLEEVSGWDNLRELRWLDIDECGSYRTHPKMHCLPFLREARFERGYSSDAPVGVEPNFSQCIRLNRLEVWSDGQLKESGDLSTLKCLHILSFMNCQALCTINGLSGLYSLKKLNLSGCKALKRLPDLAHLKSLLELQLTRSGVEEISGLLQLHALTHLDLGFCKALKKLPHLGHLVALDHLNISGSGVEDISGVEELHFLTKLDLSGCEALKTLPHLGQLTALRELNVDYTGVEEIRGVEMLESVETMDCYRSMLKMLPDLQHLPLLQWVDLRGTPLADYCEIGVMRYNKEVERMEAEDEVTDVSDREYAHSDEELYDSYREYYPPRVPPIWC